MNAGFPEKPDRSRPTEQPVDSRSPVLMRLHTPRSIKKGFMKNRLFRETSGGLAVLLIVPAVLAALAGSASSTGAWFRLPQDRVVTWEGNVGVSGDIPKRAAICSSVKPSGGDDAPAINSAISKCSSDQVVQLSAGTYLIGNPINMKSGITLRGAGMGVTQLRGSASFKGNYLIGFEGPGYSYNLSTTPARGISGGAAKGSTKITTSSAHGWSAGDIILIDQLNNAGADPPVTSTGTNGSCTWCGRSDGKRSLGQVSRITAVPASNSAILESPLYWNYDPALKPEGVEVTGVTSNAGVEELTVDNSLAGGSSQSNYGTIWMANTFQCWLYHVEAIGAWKTMVSLKGYRNTIRSCKFHEGVPATPTTGPQYGSNRGYGIWLNSWSSANLIEDNELYHVSIGLFMNGAASGNVIAYNHITELYYSEQNWERMPVGMHGGHPMMNLFEGNWTDGMIGADFYWGSSSHNTFFRNRHHLTPGKTCGTWNISIHKNSHYYNLVGNVFGTPGVEDTYELESSNFPVCPGPKSIYMLGYDNPNGSNKGSDPNVKATLLRHLNHDSVSGKLKKCSDAEEPGCFGSNGNAAEAADSLYLRRKPAWWGNLVWPGIGPDIPGQALSIPARDRHRGTSQKRPSPPRLKSPE
jgi:hypothetical protein